MAIALHELLRRSSRPASHQAKSLLANFGVSLGRSIALTVSSAFADKVVELLPFAACSFQYLPAILTTRGSKRYAVVPAFCVDVALMATLLARAVDSMRPSLAHSCVIEYSRETTVDVFHYNLYKPFASLQRRCELRAVPTGAASGGCSRERRGTSDAVSGTAYSPLAWPT